MVRQRASNILTPTQLEPPVVERTLAFSLPEKTAPLLTPSRFKVLYGGRSGSKSTTIACILLLMGQQMPIRILCARELHKSMKGSVHKVLKDCIYMLGLQDFYEVEEGVIRGKPDQRQWLYKDKEDGKFKPYPIRQTEFTFVGLRSDPMEVKGLHGVSVMWIDEAQSISAQSIRYAVPTIRQDFPSWIEENGKIKRIYEDRGAECWFSLNPEHAEDPIFARFVEGEVDDCIKILLNYYDNPHNPASMFKDADECKRRDIDEFNNVWLGQPKKHFEGTVYNSQIRLAEEQNRFTTLKVDPAGEPPIAAFDIGSRDATACWIAQRVGEHINVLHYHEAVGTTTDYWIRYLNNLQIPVSRVWLPHDAKQHHGTGMSWEEQFRKEFGNVRTLNVTRSVWNDINVCRMMFETIRFDRIECEDGLYSLRRYRFEVVDKDTKNPKSLPVHDIHSNCADAFRYMCLAMRPEKPKVIPKYSAPASFGMFGGNGWMTL